MNILTNFILIAITIMFAHADPRNSIKIVKARCFVPDPTLVTNTKCWAVPVNRSYSQGHVRLHLTKSYNNIFINFQLFKKADIKYRPFLMNIKEDYCAFFKNNQGSVYLRIMYQMYAPYSNLNHSCPYSGDLIINGVPMDANKLPSLWPAGEYRLDVHVFNFETKLFTMEFCFEIKELRNRPK